MERGQLHDLVSAGSGQAGTLRREEYATKDAAIAGIQQRVMKAFLDSGKTETEQQISWHVVGPGCRREWDPQILVVSQEFKRCRSGCSPSSSTPLWQSKHIPSHRAPTRDSSRVVQCVG